MVENNKLQAALSYWPCRVAAVIGGIQLVSITISGVVFTTVDLPMTCVWSAALEMLMLALAVVAAGSAPKYSRLVQPLANIYCAWRRCDVQFGESSTSKQAGGQWAGGQTCTVVESFTFPSFRKRRLSEENL